MFHASQDSREPVYGNIVRLCNDIHDIPRHFVMEKTAQVEQEAVN